MSEIIEQYQDLDFIKKECKFIIIENVGEYGESFIIPDSYIENIERIISAENLHYLSDKFIKEIEDIFGVDLYDVMNNSYSIYEIEFDKDKVDFEEIDLDEDADNEEIADALKEYISDYGDVISICINCDGCYPESNIENYLKDGGILFDGEYFFNDPDYELEDKNLCIEYWDGSNHKSILFSITDVLPLPDKIIKDYGGGEINLINNFDIHYYSTNGFDIVDEDKHSISEIWKNVEKAFIMAGYKDIDGVDVKELISELKKLLF